MTNKFDRNIDYMGRKLLVAGYLYEILDSICMPDTEFDQLAFFVGENFSRLSYDRQFGLVGKEYIKSASNYLWSSYAVSASEWKYEQLFKTKPIRSPIKWDRREKDGCSYVTASPEYFN